MSAYLVTVNRLIDAPAPVLFDIIANPALHPVIDGSGTVRSVRPGNPRRLKLGSHFGMRMHLGADYRTHSVVVEFEEGRRLAWQVGGSQVWRYVFEPAVEGGTWVTEQWDVRRVPWRLLLVLAGFSRRNRRGIEATLARLSAHVAAGETAPAPAPAA